MQKTNRFPSIVKLIPVFSFFFLLVSATAVTATEKDDIAFLNRSAKAFSSVVKKAGPAVVHVQVEKVIQKQNNFSGQDPFGFFSDPFFEHFFGPQFRSPRNSPDRGNRGDRGGSEQFKQQAAGSGFIISSDGYILTNNHVVEDAAAITIKLADKRELKADIIGTDPQSDVALIKIDAENLPFLPLGDSDKLEVGEWVIAIGSPFELNQTVTVGIVSAKGRSRIGINDYENFIQTDAAINPGNSGGPLLNIYGKVIGMNTAIFSRSGGYMGIGFAIPVNMTKAVIDQLKKDGKVTRGWLGVVIQDVDEALSKSFGLKNTGGVLISEVQQKSPADKAGIKRGDILISMNGKRLIDVPDLRNNIALMTPGSKVKFELIRNGNELTLRVVIGEQPADFGKSGKNDAGSLKGMGLDLQDLDQELAAQFGYNNNQGVLITNVVQGSPAAMAGLKAGHLIEELNKMRVHNLKELKNILKKIPESSQLLLLVNLGGHSRYVVLDAN